MEERKMSEAVTCEVLCTLEMVEEPKKSPETGKNPHLNASCSLTWPLSLLLSLSLSVSELEKIVISGGMMSVGAHATFTIYWGSSSLSESLHHEMHKIHMEPETCRSLKLFQGEMMSWKEIPHYS
eukprot:768224-Hanusia_phi.AAC.1